jgi:catechol 2,3-dioxygenase-like lactoylglutathione lyase family enzyme
MAGEDTKNWTFHHFGVIVGDMDKVVEYYRSLGIVDFPPAAGDVGSPVVWQELTSYGETVLKDGKLVDPPAEKENLRPGRVMFCSIGSMQFELIQPGEAIKDVNGDFLERVGGGINHIAYTVSLENYEQEVEKMKAKGVEVLFSGKQANGGGFTYFDTRGTGGIIIELMVG